MNASSGFSSLPLSADLASRLDVEFERALSRAVFPGASLLVSSGGSILLERTWGRVESEGSPVLPSTRFDLASLTKPLVTAPLCIWAVARGILRLDDRLDRFYPPDIIPDGKRGITIHNLLSHSSGLPPYKPFYLELVKLPVEQRRHALLSMILDTPLQAPSGKAADYSDLGFMLLGLILEKQMGGRLDYLAGQVIFDPLGMDELHFCPIESLEK